VARDDRNDFGVGALGVVCLPTGSPEIQEFVYKPKHGALSSVTLGIILRFFLSCKLRFGGFEENGFGAPVHPQNL